MSKKRVSPEEHVKLRSFGDPRVMLEMFDVRGNIAAVGRPPRRVCSVVVESVAEMELLHCNIPSHFRIFCGSRGIDGGLPAQKEMLGPPGVIRSTESDDIFTQLSFSAYVSTEVHKSCTSRVTANISGAAFCSAPAKMPDHLEVWCRRSLVAPRRELLWFSSLVI
ncbi:hypothetical protein ACVWW5_008383 [Bradyrhizobium sp. LM3.4]